MTLQLNIYFNLDHLKSFARSKSGFDSGLKMPDGDNGSFDC